MLKSKIKYGDQKAHAVTAAFKLFEHDHARTLLIYQCIHAQVLGIPPCARMCPGPTRPTYSNVPMGLGPDSPPCAQMDPGLNGPIYSGDMLDPDPNE